MRVLVLYNSVQSLDKGEVRDLVSAQSVAMAATAVTEALRPNHEIVCLPVDFDPAEVVAEYDAREWVVFNLLEGMGNRADLEPEAAAILGRLGYRYTGCPPEAMALCLNKGATKKLLESMGIPTPSYEVSDAPRAAFSVSLPAIVKPLAEDASLGIDDGAVVTTVEQLRARVEYVVCSYKQPALVEEFIDGREFNVALWGNGVPQCLPLAEIDYSAFSDPLRRICSYGAKWEPERAEYHQTPVTCPADVTPELTARIRSAAIGAYEAVGCRGYARVDMRVRDGTPYVLEVNPNPDISPDAGYARAALAAGYGYPEMIEEILLLGAHPT